MTYDIFSTQAPVMPRIGKGTEVIGLLLSKASKEMRQPLLPMIFPPLAAHLNSSVELMYSDNKYYEIGAGQMGHIIGNSGVGKNQLTYQVDAVCRDFSEHDEGEYRRLADWSRQMKTLGNSKTKPERPQVYFTFPPSNITPAAFTQNAEALEHHGGRVMYLNLPEVGLADRIACGHKAVSQLIRQCYDVARSGQLRATESGITANPRLRLCLTLSSTPDEARDWYKRDMVNGTFGRISFSYVPPGERKGRIPRLGTDNDEEYLAKLDQYLLRLTNATGRFVVKPLNKVADQLAQEMCDLANLADSDELFQLSHRSIFSAWKKAAVLWLLNDQTYSRSIGEWMIYFCYYDLWAKLRVFNDMLGLGEPQLEDSQKRGPKNLLDELQNPFNEQQLENLRASLGKSKEGTKHQIAVWRSRGFIEYSAQTGLYSKTDTYLKRK